MARFVIAIIFFALALGAGLVGMPRALQDHALLRAAQPVPAVSQGATLTESRGSKNRTNYNARPTVVATTPEGDVTTSFLDVSLDMTYSTRSRRSRDAWALRYGPSVPLQAWYVPSSALPPSMVAKVGTGNPLVFLNKQYVSQDLLMVGLAFVLTGLGLSVLGNQRSQTPKVRSIAGSEPPMLEVVARRVLWPTAIFRVAGGIVALLPMGVLAGVLLLSPAADVPRAVWIMLGMLGLVSIVLALMGFGAASQALAFAQPKVMIEQDGLRIGRTNLIALAASARLEPSQPVTLTVQCERMQWVGSGKQRQLKRSTEWSHTLHGHQLSTNQLSRNQLSTNQPAGIASALGYSQHDAWQLPIPTFVPVTQPAKGDIAGYCWTLKLKQKTKGNTLAMEFPVVAKRE